ncbi:MAG: acetyl-CoA carboxylase, biotin carboxyl carrier protein [Rhodoferax sp.]|nr:acetyl-CoA carboxylase, biotin carboxyl carrier protein [Rhodoferax sp.]
MHSAGMSPRQGQEAEMNLTEIKSLIDAMAASDLSEMELTRDGTLLRLVRRPSIAASDPLRTAGPSIAPAAPPTPTPAFTETPAPASREITAPLYGVVHWRPSPDAAPFVTPGQAIATGQVVCVIEAMKVFNEVRAEGDATVTALLVESGAEVEAGQRLLTLG